MNPHNHLARTVILVAASKAKTPTMNLSRPDRVRLALADVYHPRHRLTGILVDESA